MRVSRKAKNCKMQRIYRYKWVRIKKVSFTKGGYEVEGHPTRRVRPLAPRAFKYQAASLCHCNYS